MDFWTFLVPTAYLTVIVMSVTNSLHFRNEKSASTYLKSFTGQVLNSHVIAQYHVKYELSCSMRCVAHNTCLSYNYQPISNLERNILNCQLNNATRLTSPESYVRQPGRIYCEVVELQIATHILEDRSVNESRYISEPPLTYDLTFPVKGLSSYVSLTWPTNPFKPMINLTLCLWMKTADSENGCPFSYAVTSSINEVTICKGTIYIHDEHRSTSLGTFFDGRWHHVCLVWMNTGHWQVFVDGVIISNGHSLQAHHTIQTGGMVIVGQEQDCTQHCIPGDPDGFQMNQSFMGSITGLNVWDRVYTADEILSMSQTCNPQTGSVLQWSDLQVSLHGEVLVESPSACKVSTK